MRIAIALIVVAAILSHGSYAAEAPSVHVADGLDYAVPSKSPVQFASLGKFGVATFRGRFVMSGTYHYGYLTDDPRADATYGVLELYFLPDENVAAQLPYWVQRKPVHEIRFRNDNAFVRAVITPETIEVLKKKQVFSVEGRTSIVVSDYQASVECDYPTYSVLFVSVEHPGMLLASREFIEQYGC